MASSKDREPHVPAGWVACWDGNQNMWYYGNQSAQASQWQAPEGTFFPPENDLPSYEQTAQTGVEKACNQDLESRSFQAQNEHINSRKHQPLQQSDMLLIPHMPVEMADFKPPPLGISNTETIFIFITIILSTVAWGVGLLISLPI